MHAQTMILAALAVAIGALRADAQVIGSFSWQTQPFCNRVEVTVVQYGGVYQLLGTDDQCGAGSAPVTGTAVPAGTGVAMGLTIAASDGRATHLSATVSLPGLGGTWSDAAGRSGPFVFAAAASGLPRPVPARSAGGVIAMGFVNAFAATPVVQELRAAAGITVTVTSPSVGRIDLTVTGADTADIPIVMVTPHSIALAPRTCNSRTLQVLSATSYTARFDCYDADGAAAANTSFQFIVVD